jgi:hypothetical protein
MAQMPEQQAVPPQASKTTVSIGNWILSLILSAIPIVNLICLLVWAISGNTIKSKKNWAIAMLIFMAIGIVLGIISWASVGSLIKSLTGTFSY